MLLFAFVQLLLNAAESASPVVQTEYGAVQGFSSSVLGREINTFRGIPFAADTGGSNRCPIPHPETIVKS